MITIKAFGKRFGFDEPGIYSKLIELGYLRSNGYPKKKYLSNGYFDTDDHVLNIKALSNEFEELIEDEDDEDSDNELYTWTDLVDVVSCSESVLSKLLTKAGYLNDNEDWTKQAKIDLLNKDELITDKGLKMIQKIVNRMKPITIETETDDFDIDSLKNTLNNFIFSKKSDISDLIKELVDRLVDFESESEKLGNKPGEFKGWTIYEPKGGLVYAKKGKETLKTTIKGNIRSLINKQE